MSEGNTDSIDVGIARRMLIWLSFECPSGGNPIHCPGHAIRLKTIPERKAWIEGLSDQECLDFYERHLACEARCVLEAKRELARLRALAQPGEGGA